MESLFKTISLVAIWGCTLGTTYWVGKSFGALAGFLFFLFGAGLAGFAGMLLVTAIARIFGIHIEE